MNYFLFLKKTHNNAKACKLLPKFYKPPPPFYKGSEIFLKLSMKSKSNRNIFFSLIAANNHIAKLWLTCNWETCCGHTGFSVYTNTPVYKY